MGLVCLTLAGCGGSVKTIPQIQWAAPAPIPYGTALSAAQLDASASVPGVLAYSPSLGAVLSAGAQTLSVTFTPTDTSTYASSTASVTLTVIPTPTSVSWAAPAAIAYGTALSAAQLNATASVPGTLTYSPSLGAVLSAGAQTLSVTFAPADTNFATSTASVTLTVNPATPVLNWTTPASIPYGVALSAAQLNATASVSGAFVYTPSPGTQLTLGAHLLSVTFTPTDSRDYTPAAASVSITVVQATPQIGWAAPTPIPYGTALSATQLDATANTPGSFVYSQAAGTLFSVGAHTLSVTFTPSDTTDYTTAAASVKLTVNQAIPVVSWTAPAAIPYGSALSATQLDAASNLAGSFSYAPALGAVLTAGLQSLSVTFTPADLTDYTTVKISVPLTVNQATPAITWTAPAAIPYGTALSAVQLNAASNLPGNFTYTPASGSVLTAGSQTLSVTFTPADSTDYSSAKASVQLTVNQATPATAWATPAAILYGTALSATQLDASSPVAGSFSYSPALGTVLTAGSQTLSATFTPADSTDYTTSTASVTLTVNQATPIIHWTPRALIAVNVPIGSGQLNATATSLIGPLTGTFNYSPPAGTLFTMPGTQSLSVTFIPADAQDYTTSSLTISAAASVFGVAAWGDSLTFGNEGYTDYGDYPDDLAALIKLPVVNLGVSGQTSTQVAVREGGVSTYATVVGGVIPASGGVTVTFPTGFEPATLDGPAAGVDGTILGVHGTVTCDPTTLISTFTRSNPGSAVSAPGTGADAPQFVVDTPYANYIPVIWVGRNNSTNPTQILSDIAAMVKTAVDAGQDYLILADPNINSMDEWLGGSNYPYIVNTNDQLATIYGSHYLDIRKVLVDSYDPTLITDLSDFQHDEPPTSLREVGRQTTLANPVGLNDTTVTLTSMHNIGEDWILTLDGGTPNAENVLITAVSGNTVTVVRNYGGVQTSHNAGASADTTQPVHFNAQAAQIEANQIADYLSDFAD